MNALSIPSELRGRLGVFSGRLKQHWSRLTRNENRFAEGRFQEIACRMRLRSWKTCQRLGMSLDDQPGKTPLRAEAPG